MVFIASATEKINISKTYALPDRLCIKAYYDKEVYKIILEKNNCT